MRRSRRNKSPELETASQGGKPDWLKVMMEHQADQQQQHAAQQQQFMQQMAQQQQQQAAQQQLLMQQMAQLMSQNSTQQQSSSSSSQPPQTSSVPALKSLPAPKLSSPDNLSIPEFRDWKQRWEDYTGVVQLHLQPLHTQHGVLRSALDTEWTILWNSGCIPITSATTLSDIISALETYLRSRRNPILDRRLFHRRDQMPGESVDRYYAALKTLDDAAAHEAALQCVNCTSECQTICTNCDEVFPLDRHFQDIRIRDRLICGLRDKEMQKKVLAEPASSLSLSQVLAICSAVENANNTGATLCSSDPFRAEAAAVRSKSTYKKQRLRQQSPDDRPETCINCGKLHDDGKCSAKGKTCSHCGKLGHFASVCFTKKRQEMKSGRTSPRASSPTVNDSVNKTPGQANAILGSLHQGDFISIPTRISDCTYMLRMKPDTGADLDGIGITMLQQIAPELKPTISAQTEDADAANGQSLGVMGSLPATFSYNNRTHHTVIQVYKHLQLPLLSKNSCIALGLIPHDWPHSVATSSNSAALAISTGEAAFIELSRASATAQSISTIKESIVKEHAEAFNDSTLKPMEGPPMEIQLIEGATPCKRYRAHTVPYHWRDQVKEQLDTMVKKGIIEPVPVGEPIDWCHPMVVVPKKGSSEPRITVDLTGLNKFVRRPAYPVRVPKEVVARIPPGQKYYTTLDARHGYWQVPLEPESRKLTTFITPWGSFRYCRNVMGLISAGDEHNRRGDDALAGIQNVEKIVEDIIIYDTDLPTHIKRVHEVIQRCQDHGITLNAKKFVFAEQEVEWCGFHLSAVGYTPAPHLVSALANFPIPTSKTDVRSFCGLVQQFEAFSYTITEHMSPIRALLSAKSAFVWEQPHQLAFENVIHELISPRVLTHFNPSRNLRLETDAAQTKGLGYALWQEENHGIWKLLQAGSRFVTPTESRYSASEAEMLAVVWAIKKCRLYLLGKQFELIVDHRPLIPIINSKTLDEIDNPRLQRFKEKLSSYRPHAIWRAGTKHTVVDVFSRYPTADPDTDDLAHELDADPKPMLLAALTDPDNGSWIINDPNLQGVREAAALCSEYRRLLQLISNGFPDKHLWDEDLRPFYKSRNALTVDDNLIYLGARLVIPRALRPHILRILHQSHQGQTRTLRRAQQAVFWPGISNDVRNVVKSCRECASHLPALPKEPIVSDPPPPYPFHTVGIDLFSYAGKEYLVMIDKLSGWINVAKCGTSATTSAVIHLLKGWFADFGIPVKIISDNGPQLASFEFSTWTKKWGITQETSSPHYPQSNGLAESAVKSIKSLLSKTTTSGDLQCDEFQLGLLELRNTPRENGASPAQLLYGAPTRTLLPQNRSKFQGEWKATTAKLDARAQHLREKARIRYDSTAHRLQRLSKGDIVRVRDHRTRLWDLIAEIVEEPWRGRSYVLRTESGRVLRRNRRFLRPFTTPADEADKEEPPATTTSPTPQPPPRRSGRVRKSPERYMCSLRWNHGFHLKGGHVVCPELPHEAHLINPRQPVQTLHAEKQNDMERKRCISHSLLIRQPL